MLEVGYVIEVFPIAAFVNLEPAVPVSGWVTGVNSSSLISRIRV